MNGAERAHRADIFASPAADAALAVNSGHFYCLAAWAIDFEQFYGSVWAVAGAVAAACALGYWQAEGFFPNGMANLDTGFFRPANLGNGACRANFAAFSTFRAAIAFIKAHFRLHQLL